VGLPPGTTVYLENGDPSPILLGPVMARVKPLFPGRAAIFVLTHCGDELDGHHVRFIERDPAVLARIGGWPGDPLATLLVRPDDHPREAEAARGHHVAVDPRGAARDRRGARVEDLPGDGARRERALALAQRAVGSEQLERQILEPLVGLAPEHLLERALRA